LRSLLVFFENPPRAGVTRRRYTQIIRGNQKAPVKKGNPVNEDIRADKLRVIDDDGEQAGIMLREAALELADRRGLDLVLISPNADPPVAKVMDYGKYRFDQQKREKEAKKKQRVIQVKEIRLSTFIDSHDLTVKAGAAARFLKEGDKLKVSLRFKGRERGRTERGYEVVNRFADLIKEYGIPEKAPSMEGRSLTMIVAPLPPKKEKPAGAEGEGAQPEAAGQAAGGAGAAAAPEKPKPKPAQDQPPKKKQKGPSEEMDF
jgi:translation initiation factor IF-3